MPRLCGQNGREPAMRWFCGVPVLANPLILIDLASAALIMWFVTVTLVVLAQVTLGDEPLRGAHIAAACSYATYVSLLLPVLYTAVCLLFFRRGYVILYRIEDACLYMETMRATTVAGGSLFNARPFTVPDVLSPPRSVVREVEWNDVRSVRELKDARIFQLRGRFGTLAQIYCPTTTVYDQALARVRKKVSPTWQN